MAGSSIVDKARSEGRTLLTEIEAKQMLEEAGVPVSPARLAKTRDEAVAVARVRNASNAQASVFLGRTRARRDSRVPHVWENTRRSPNGDNVEVSRERVRVAGRARATPSSLHWESSA